MSTEICELGTIEEARQFAAERGGPFLVLSRDTLDQIESAEAAGGFEGGMTGASGEGGFSAPGSGGPDSSSDTDPAQIEGVTTVTVGVWIEERLERLLSARDVLEAWEKHQPLGPIILVPVTELNRWLGRNPDEA